MSQSFSHDSTKKPVSSQTQLSNHQLPGQRPFVVQQTPQAPEHSTAVQCERMARLDAGVMRTLNLQAKEEKAEEAPRGKRINTPLADEQTMRTVERTGNPELQLPQEATIGTQESFRHGASTQGGQGRKGDARPRVAFSVAPGRVQMARTRSSKKPGAGPGNRLRGGVRKRQRRSNVTRSIPTTIELHVPQVTQPTSNVCWAAAGFSIQKHRNRRLRSLDQFVKRHGSLNAKSNFKSNKVTDIDEIIGSTSQGNNLLGGSDNVSSWSKAVISRELGSNKPIVACIGSATAGHYVVIDGKRNITGSYELHVMDPAGAMRGWQSTGSSGGNNRNIDSVGGRKIAVLYYTA